MKQSFCTLIAIVLLSYSGPGQTKPELIATASIFADMAQNIVGDLYDIETIVPIGGDPHIYEPTPQDASLINHAKLILRNGLTFEGWLNELIEHSGTKATVITITDSVNAISSSQYENATDPHAWMDPLAGLKYVQNIYHALVQYDPDNADIFRFNYNVYHQQIEDIHDYITGQISTIPATQRVLITSHDAFQYYGRRYGIELESALGTSTDADVQTSDVRRLNRIIKEKNIPAIFVESTINPKLLEQLAKDNGIVIGGKLYSDSLGEEGGPADTYLNMLKHNTDIIVKGLNMEKKDQVSEADSGANWWLIGMVGLLFLLGFLMMWRKSN